VINYRNHTSDTCCNSDTDNINEEFWNIFFGDEGLYGWIKKKDSKRSRKRESKSGIVDQCEWRIDKNSESNSE